MTLYDRNGKVAMRAGGYNTHYGGGSDCLNILDHRTGQRRRPVLNDVVEAATVMDALPEIDFVMSLFLPEDVDQRIYDRYQMEVMLNNTTKPIVFVTPDFEGCVAAVEMCEVVAGGAEAFQRRPFATCYINVTSGLIANAEALQKCMYLAEKGLPLLYIPLNAGGVNSPVTTAGCMASMNAGILLGIVLSQLVRARRAGGGAGLERRPVQPARPWSATTSWPTSRACRPRWASTTTCRSSAWAARPTRRCSTSSAALRRPSA